MFTRIGTLLLFILTVSVVQAQTAKLAGKVTDAESGAPLVGATVTYGGSKGASSDVEGNFFLPLEQGKKYDVKITSVGYQPKLLSDVQLSDNAPTLTVSLERTTGQLTAVVVTSTSARRESISSIYAAQKNSSAISDAISADVIRKSPDRNTGDVLKRVSGASVQDNKFVVIRGLSERYNVALLNNSMLPSTEPDKKAFSFDIIPSSLIDNLVIYKSATPDLPGDFSGGAIKVSTKDYPSKKVSELSFSAGFNSQTTFQNFYKGYPNGKYDALGFFDNETRLIPAPYYKRRGAAFFNTSPEFKREVTKLFPNTFGYEPAYKSLPNFSFSYTGGNTAVIGGNKLGYIYSIGYSEGHRVINRDRSEFDPYDISKALLYTYNTTNYDVRNNLSALVNLTYAYGRSKISWKNLFNNDFTKTVAQRNGRNEVNRPDVLYYKSSNSEAMNNGLFNSVVEGMHKVGQKSTIDWAGSYGLTYRNQPDQRILTFVTDYQNPNTYFLKIGTENSPEIRNAGRVYSYLLENIYGLNANLTKEFDWLGQAQKLKFGTYNYVRQRSVEVDALGYGTQNTNGSNPPIIDGKGLSFSTILRPEIIDQYNIILANIPGSSTDYTGTVLSNAGYAMLDNKFSDKLKLTWGARVEKYRQELKAKGKSNLVKDNTDVLPSFILTYALSKKTNLRLAGSEAVNRPEFRELADYRVFDYENYITVSGNPNLVRSQNQNADLRYEWFPSGGEIVSASLFYKHFKNPIEQVNLGNDVYSFANADYATSIGAELEVRKKLDFINNDFFSHVTAYANAAFIKGKVKFGEVTTDNPLQGQSPYLINSGLSYTADNDAFSVNVLYNKIGPRLRARAPLGGGQNVYEKPRDMMDLQVSKKLLNKRMEVKVSVNDLFAQPFVWYYKYEPNPSNINYNAATDKIMNSYKLGTTTTIALRYNLGK